MFDGILNRDFPDERHPHHPRPRPGLLNKDWTPAAFPRPGKNGEIGAVGQPDGPPGAPTVPSGSSHGQSLSPHGRRSPSSARHHSHPPATNDHPGLGVAGSRPIRAVWQSL